MPGQFKYQAVAVFEGCDVQGDVGESVLHAIENLYRFIGESQGISRYMIDAIGFESLGVTRKD